jgi:glycosyltransferase involved in cell wall biosynthesis
VSGDRLAVYYHMPCFIEGGTVAHVNPVIGTFLESLATHFQSVVLLSPEVSVPDGKTSYRVAAPNVSVVGLGGAGHYWDHFGKMRRIRRAVEQTRREWDILLLRVPSPHAYAVWKYAGRPARTALFFVGNTVPREGFVFRGPLGRLLLVRAMLFDLRLRRLCGREGTLVMANSPSLVRYWKEKSVSPVELVNTSSFSSGDVAPSCRTDLFHAPPFRLLYVGRVCRDKGIHELLESLRLLNREQSGGHHLDIVGPCADADREWLLGWIEGNRVQELVRYHGAVRFGLHLFDYYRKADAYVLPSYHEGMPKTVWEAMSQGTPVIATRVGGIRDFFEDGKDILFIQPRNVESIVNAVRRLAQDRDLARRLSIQGIGRARSVTREVQAARIAKLMSQRWGVEVLPCVESQA